MSNKSTMILAGAIALCAIAYFVTHLHIPCGPNNTLTCNSVTGDSVVAATGKPYRGF